MKITIRQHQNLSKFLYDIAKLSFAGFVVGSIISKEPMGPFVLIVGLGITICLAIIALSLDKEDEG
ncbi:MAG: DUF6722 family protein [bacterium]